MKRVRNTARRLLITYMVITTILFLSAFIVLNSTLKDYVKDSSRRKLKHNMQTMERFYKTGGLSALEALAKEDVIRMGESKFFISVVDGKNRKILEYGGKGWSGLDPWEMARIVVQKKGRGFFIKNAFRGHHWPWGFYAKKLPDGNILVAGLPLKQERVLTEHMEETLAFFFILLFIATTVSGVLLSKKSLKRAAEISFTAMGIHRSGNLSRRIPESDRGDEFDLISSSFNRMLDGLEKAVKSVREAMDAISHDIKTPLSRIRSACQLGLSKKRKPDEYQEILQDVLEDTNQLLKLLEMELDISEAEAGALPLNLEKISLASLITPCVDMMEPLAAERNVSLTYDIKSDVKVLCDRKRVFQALSNLLDNAIKFNRKGGYVTVRLRERNDFAAIEVEDSGIGIKEEELERIFQRFYRADSSRSTPGYGLGLSLVKAVAEMHGGRIEVKSEPGKGSIFSFYIPRKVVN